MRKLVRSLGRWGLVVTCAALGGCATVAHGSRQRIHVVTDPPGAQASLGKQSVRTPGDLRVRRGRRAEVAIHRDGCLPANVRLDRELAPELARNAIVAGVGLGIIVTAAQERDGLEGLGAALAGLATMGMGGLGTLVDLATGAAFRVEPDALHVELVCGPDASTTR